MKAKLAKLKEKAEQRISGGGKGGKAEGYSVRKTGDGTVIIVGFPSVGKSTLLNKITNAKSEVGAYAFTTLTAVPGLLEHKHAKIQVLDVPGIVEGAAKGTGRGREVLACAMSADMVMFVVDAFHPEHLDILKKEVYDSHIRLDKRKPDVRITKTAKGGVNVGSTVPLTKIDEDTIKKVFKEFKISNADVVLRTDIDVDELIDVIEGNKKYIPSIIVVNKCDLLSEDMKRRLEDTMHPDLMISAATGYHLEELKELIFKKMNFIRIFCKEVGKKADMEEPMIMFRDSTIGDMCNKLHKDFVEKFKFARIWGESAKFEGQTLRKLDHTLMDGDVVELHMK
jgi:hypothetical protein